MGDKSNPDDQLDPELLWYQTEQAMAPRLRIFLIILAVGAGCYIGGVFRDKVWRPGFSIKEHLWGGPFTAGYALGTIGIIIPVAVFMLWWTGVFKWLKEEQGLGLALTGLLMLASFVTVSVCVYVHDFKIVWRDEAQMDGFRQGTFAALVVVSYFMSGFALITNRMPKPWRNRAYNKHARASASRVGRAIYLNPESAWDHSVTTPPLYDGGNDHHDDTERMPTSSA